MFLEHQISILELFMRVYITGAMAANKLGFSWKTYIYDIIKKTFFFFKSLYYNNKKILPIPII